MAVAYATPADLQAFTGRPNPPQVARLLERASTTVAYYVRAYIRTDRTTGQPLERAAAIRDAVCAQVEFWMSASERVDIRQWEGPPAEGKEHPLAHRAHLILSNAGLLNPTLVG